MQKHRGSKRLFFRKKGRKQKEKNFCFFENGEKKEKVEDLFTHALRRAILKSPFLLSPSLLQKNRQSDCNQTNEEESGKRRYERRRKNTQVLLAFQ